MIVALDFETANASRGSICSVGVALFEDGRVLETREILVHPHASCDFFDPFHISIHGITPSMVADAPEWGTVWKDQLEPLFRNQTVIAHNAAFDISVLRTGLSLYGLEFPEFDYLCTCKLASRVWPDLLNHKLNTVCDYIGHSFRHHNAEADAEAAAFLLAAMVRETGSVDPFDLAERCGIAPGRLYAGGYCPCSVKKTSVRKRRNDFA